MSHIRAIAWLVGLTLLICCVLYPAVLWGVGQALFPAQANGSLVTGRDGKPVGSRLIAQAFTGDEYFQPRPSAAGYNAAASGASNWGASNPKLRFRVARQLGPIVKYADDPANGDRRGKPVGPDVERWFAEKDRLADWAANNSTAAGEWVKTNDTTKTVVADWAKANPDVLDRWKKDNPGKDAPNPEEKPEDLAVPFFASFAAKYPRAFPVVEEVKGPDRKPEKHMKPGASGADLQGVFFDAWLQEHPQAVLEKVPADMVTASGSGLDPHITLRNARYQLDRVAAARGGQKDAIDKLLVEHSSAPLAGLAGERLVNVLEVNLELDKRFPKPAAR
jgi:potassium-transporting ATPase KdpC subunit